MTTLGYDIFCGRDPMANAVVYFGFSGKTRKFMHSWSPLETVCQEMTKDVSAGRRILLDIDRDNPEEGKLLAMYAKMYPGHTSDRFFPLEPYQRKELQRLFEKDTGMANHPNNPFNLENQPQRD